MGPVGNCAGVDRADRLVPALLPAGNQHLQKDRVQHRRRGRLQLLLIFPPQSVSMQFVKAFYILHRNISFIVVSHCTLQCVILCEDEKISTKAKCRSEIPHFLRYTSKCQPDRFSTKCKNEPDYECRKESSKGEVPGRFKEHAVILKHQAKPSSVRSSRLSQFEFYFDRGGKRF